ncbi:hypothetical protein EDC27_1360 [Desulfosoma caldarium]|uniref:Uncharacterized protein n=1 Tax=Desulfosoma caldarium TaxID=610254 RepID=A0A3N1UQE9_9BACT|nr:hypothetical protein EDC27_1360 [Desulfosoma caldarium]
MRYRLTEKVAVSYKGCDLHREGSATMGQARGQFYGAYFLRGITVG